MMLRSASGAVCVAATLAGLALLGGASAAAQNDWWETEYEWNPREGVHEEEWYDLGDWFDWDNSIEYDYDWGYGTGYYNDDYGYYDSDGWYDGGYYDNYNYYGYNTGYDGWYEDDHDTGWHGHYDHDRYNRYDDHSSDWYSDDYRGYGWDDYYDTDDYWEYSDDWGAGAAGSGAAYAANFDDYEGWQADNRAWERSSRGDYQYREYRSSEPRVRAYSGGSDSLAGRLMAFEALATERGQPIGVLVALRDQDGRTRTVIVGERGGRSDTIRLGEQVRVQGNFVRVNGRTLLHAAEVIPAGERFHTDSRNYDVSVQGRLSDIHYAKTSGNQVRAIVANVETDDGRRRPVLIGAQQALGGSADTLYDGAYVNFSGRRGRAYNGEAEFVVTGIYVEQPSSGYVVQAAPRTYEVYEAPRTYEVYTAPRTYAAGRGTTQFFRGEIATLDERDVNGREHYIAELEIGDDRYIRVDLGPKEQLDELDMESGDEIQVQGYRGTLLGRSMLLATFVEGDDGETATISRDQYGNIRNTWVQEED